jgi:hypothetical protein
MAPAAPTNTSTPTTTSTTTSTATTPPTRHRPRRSAFWGAGFDDDLPAPAWSDEACLARRARRAARRVVLWPADLAWDALAFLPRWARAPLAAVAAAYSVLVLTVPWPGLGGLHVRFVRAYLAALRAVVGAGAADWWWVQALAWLGGMGRAVECWLGSAGCRDGIGLAGAA